MSAKKDNKFQNIKIPTGKDYVTILITTAEHLIRGKLYLPIPSVVENPSTENLLFYALNCGNMFISIHDCIIMNRENVEYQPERVSYYNINLNIVHSCQIVDDIDD